MNENVLLSAELLSDLCGSSQNESGLLITSSMKKKRKKGGDVDPEVKSLARHLSKTQRKKLEKISENKAKAEKRGELYEKLEKTQLSSSHLQLMQSSGTLGQKMTLRERLKRTVQLALAGIQPSKRELMEFEIHSKILPEVEEALGLPCGGALSALLGLEVARFSAEDADCSKQQKKMKCDVNGEIEDIPLKDGPDFFGSSKKSNKYLEASKAEDNEPHKLVLSRSNSDWASKINSSLDSFQKSVETLNSKNSSLHSIESTHLSKISSESKDIVPQSTPSMTCDSSNKRHNSNDLPSAHQILPSKKFNDVKKVEDLKGLVSGVMNAENLGSSPSEDEFLKACLPLKYCPVIGRPEAINEQRMKLPVCGMEQEIMESLRTNDIIVVCAETGSGKSTQIPQFAYEAGYARNGRLIGVTQPRRVATVSTANRVAYEMGTTCNRSALKGRSKKGGLVAYHIRYDSTSVTKDTRIKFMTDGILLRELCADLLLRKYSVIFLDEAHERGLNTDLILGLLSRAVPLRRKLAKEAWEASCKRGKMKEEVPLLSPLKVVIMSATLGVREIVDNVRLFPKDGLMKSNTPPVIQVPSRQFPVTVYFSKRTEMFDYLGASFKKVCKIHRTLPPGAILLFLPGRREILDMCKRLESEFSPKRKNKKSKRRNTHQDSKNYDSITEDKDELALFREKDDEEIDNDIIFGSDSDSVVDESELSDSDDLSIQSDSSKQGNNKKLSGRDEESASVQQHSGKVTESEYSSAGSIGPVWVLPLYAMLTSEQQSRVFCDPPPGHRLIVVATNVAETSVTIPGVRYVVDCGRAKERRLEHTSGISMLKTCWVSQASADQRAGRAGRVCAGYCYRLYSSAVYTQKLTPMNPPEVCTRQLEEIILQMKVMGIDNVSTFPFPTLPNIKGMKAANQILRCLGALQDSPNEKTGTGVLEGISEGAISSLGKAISMIPINPRYAKMILLAKEGGILQHGIAMVAMLTERDPFLRGEKSEMANEDDDENQENLKEQKQERKAARQALMAGGGGDALVLLRTAGAYVYCVEGGKMGEKAASFCQKLGLHGPTMDRVLQLWRQLNRLASVKFSNSSELGENLKKDHCIPLLNPPTPEQEILLRQMLLSGLLDCVAKRASSNLIGLHTDQGSRLKGWRQRSAYLSCSSDVSVPLYVRHTSSVFTADPDDLPEWVTYVGLEGLSKGFDSQDFETNRLDDGGYAKDDMGEYAFMRCVTPIDPAWITALGMGSPMMKLGEPLKTPSPFYDKTQDKIMTYAYARYGVHSWSIPHALLPLVEVTDRDQELRWFARLLLEGKIEPAFEELSRINAFSDPPSMITHSHPMKKVTLLLRSLKGTPDVISLSALRNRWNKDSNYLKSSIMEWIKKDQKPALDKVWKIAVNSNSITL